MLRWAIKQSLKNSLPEGCTSLNDRTVYMRILRPMLFAFLGSCWLTSLAGRAEVMQDSAKAEELLAAAELLTSEHSDSALFLARKAESIGRSSQFAAIRIKAYNRMGIIHRKLGNLDSAEVSYQRSLEISSGLKDSLGMATAWHNLGVLARKKGMYSQALEYEMQSIPIIERLGDQIELAHVYTSMGNIFMVQENREKAIEYYTQALELHQAVPNPIGELRMAYNLGIAHFESEQMSAADSLFSHALTLARRLDQKAFLANTHHSLGVMEQELKNWESAAFHYDSAALYFEQLNDLEGQLYVLTGTGDLLMKHGRYTLAEERIQKALTLARSIGIRDEEAYALGLLADVYESQGRQAESLQILKQQIALKDSLSEEALSERVIEMQEKYESEKKDQENALLQKENSWKAQQLEAKDEALLFRSALIMVLVITLTLAILLTVTYRRRMQSERLISEQQEKMNQQKMLDLMRDQEMAFKSAAEVGRETERSRIAADLHDGLSNTLAALKLLFENFGDRLSHQQPELNKTYQHNLDLLSEACQDARSLAHRTATEQGSFELQPALEKMVELIRDNSPLNIELSMYLLEEPLGQAAESAVFYTLREIIGNCVKHAQAQDLFIQITRHDDALNLLIEDNGKGFDPKQAMQNQQGMGLTNIATRIDNLGGTFVIESSPEKGTTITIELPAPALKGSLNLASTDNQT